MEFAIGGLAAASAGVFTNPLEVLKHHMELHKKSQHVATGQQRGLLHTGYTLARRDGVRSLQKGLSPALCSHLVSYGMKLGTYQFLANRGFTKDFNGEVVVLKSVALSGVGGILGQFLSSPFYLIKAQKEIECQAASKKVDNDGYLNTVKNVYRDQGVRGFFRGAITSLPRAFIGTSQLTSFALAKEMLGKVESLKDLPFFSTFLASCFAAVVLSLAMTPFDMILTKMYKQAIHPVSHEKMYAGFLDCMKKTYKVSGIRPFYSGFGSISLKLGPHTILCLVFWENLKDIYDEYSYGDLENSVYKSNLFREESYNPDSSCDFCWEQYYREI